MVVRHNISLAAAAVVFVLMGVATRIPDFLFLAIPPVALLAVAFLFRPAPMALRVERTVEPDRTVVGSELTVRIGLRNEGEDLPLLEIFDRLPLGTQLTRGSNHHLLALRRGATVTVEYRVVPRSPGSYAFGPMVLRNRDALGVQAEERVVPPSPKVAVTPPVERLRRFAIRPRRTKVWLGQILARRRGFGTEFWGIREYASGDEVRKMNWKASARLAKLMTNENEAEQSGDAVIVVDARRHADVGPLGAGLADHGARAAMSLAAKLLNGRDRVGLIVQRDVIDWVPLGSGRRHLLRIAGALVATRPSGNWPFSAVRRIVRRLFPTQCHLILITPLLDRTEFEAIEGLLADGFEVFVLSPSPVALEASTADGEPLTDLAVRVLSFERYNYVAQLRRRALVADWDPALPLAAVLEGVRPYPVRR